MNSINDVAQAPFDPSAGQNLTQPGGALGKDDFMSLLIAQLANQDPMSPTDPTEFVSQLSQFSSLEQLVNLGSGMEFLAVTQTAGTSAQMVSFIGKTVAFDDTSVAWSQGDAPASVNYSLNAPAGEVNLRITDQSGATIETRELGARGAGDHNFEFTGRKQDGTELDSGTYHVEISAMDTDGNPIAIQQQARAQVAGVTFEAGYPQLVLEDGRRLGLAQIIEVLAGASDSASAPDVAPSPAPDDKPDRPTYPSDPITIP